MRRVHLDGVREIRTLMEAREMDTAAERLDGLSGKWEKSQLKVSNNTAFAGLKPLHRELAEIEIEIVNLELGVEAETAALLELRKRIRDAKGLGDKQAFIALKKAMQVAQEAGAGIYVADLKSTIAEVQGALDDIVKGAALHLLYTSSMFCRLCVSPAPRLPSPPSAAPPQRPICDPFAAPIQAFAPSPGLGIDPAKFKDKMEGPKKPNIVFLEGNDGEFQDLFQRQPQSQC